MSEEADRSSAEETPLDLESLRDLDFGPRWTTGSSKPTERKRGSSPARKGDRDSGRSDGPGPSGRDRRPARKRAAGGGEAGRGRPQPVEPVVSFTIYPEDEPFDLLVQSIRSTLKVHELFELTRLILDKPDRMVVVVHPLSDESPPLAQSIPDGKLFLAPEAALAHAVQQVLPTYFEEREEEVEPPSGNFPSVLRCRKTGVLLPPRNYHLYSSLLREHQRTHLPEMSVEAVERQLEPVADEAVVQEWVDSMSKRSTYVLRPEEGQEGAEPTVFPDRERALQHLMRTRRESLVRESRSVRLPAKELLENEDPAISGSFRTFLEDQKRFPLESSHQVRAKLRKARMQLFKQGRKGITYVSAVRRKQRPANQRFADSVERILATLDGADRTMTVRELAVRLFPEAAEGEIPAEEKKRLAQDLKWLKSEGYLLEYASGALEVQPVEKTAPSAAPTPEPPAIPPEPSPDSSSPSAAEPAAPPSAGSGPTPAEEAPAAGVPAGPASAPGPAAPSGPAGSPEGGGTESPPSEAGQPSEGPEEKPAPDEPSALAESSGPGESKPSPTPVPASPVHPEGSVEEAHPEATDAESTPPPPDPFPQRAPHSSAQAVPEADLPERS